MELGKREFRVEGVREGDAGTEVPMEGLRDSVKIMGRCHISEEDERELCCKQE